MAGPEIVRTISRARQRLLVRKGATITATSITINAGLFKRWVGARARKILPKRGATVTLT